MKVKRFVNKKLFKRDLTYELWLKNFIKPLSNNELNQMEKDSINNSSYNPIQGA